MMLVNVVIFPTTRVKEKERGESILHQFGVSSWFAKKRRAWIASLAVELYFLEGEGGEKGGRGRRAGGYCQRMHAGSSSSSARGKKKRFLEKDGGLPYTAFCDLLQKERKRGERSANSVQLRVCSRKEKKKGRRGRGGTRGSRRRFEAAISQMGVCFISLHCSASSKRKKEKVEKKRKKENR